MEPLQAIDPNERRQRIAEAAYFRAERRGFKGGDPVADWIDAEHEVDALLGGERSDISLRANPDAQPETNPRGSSSSRRKPRREKV
jgi:hypothetical protein